MTECFELDVAVFDLLFYAVLCCFSCCTEVVYHGCSQSLPVPCYQGFLPIAPVHLIPPCCEARHSSPRASPARTYADLCCVGYGLDIQANA